MIAGEIVGFDMCTSGSVGVEIGSAMTEMTLPFGGKGWAWLSLSIDRCHRNCLEVGVARCVRKVMTKLANGTDVERVYLTNTTGPTEG